MSRLSNILIVSLRSIMKNKRRNIFTMIGIIIGIAAVITIMALGNGFKKTANEQFSDSGASKDAALISFMQSTDADIKTEPFAPSDIQLAEREKGVEKAQIKKDKDQAFTAKVTNSRKNGNANIYVKDQFSNVDEGHGFNQGDNAIENKVVTIDKKLAEDLFDKPKKAVGQSLFINGQGFKIVGITTGDGFENNVVHMPTQTLEHYLPNLTQDFAQLEVKIEDGHNKKEVGERVAKVLSKKGSGQAAGSYQYSDMEEMMKGISKIFDGITYFVAAVAGISLFIAGIGVMNVMYISVAERSEEIAIRRAFGAKARDIEIQFLVESVVLCLIGGIIGLLLGIGIASLVDVVTPDYIKSAVSLGSVLLAVGVSTLIGIIFGWIPARAAAKKELIDIIK
ncbi:MULTISPECIES: ABC transporter permease [Staphylococcus]|mgnify:FL=1|uniref:ABC transporter permease n=1 Tax=Staphylococcus TaxID=1279 RepID=UPI00070FF83A|nr:MULTISPECIES: ABC transporter permease [Staphylococcus]OFM14042.1 ABC transporter permease [Staphylococcus sp. HMSC059E03]OFN19285.1 ABC transporter permease [Staphylococcus sp. HMSC055C03]OFU76506.1 ABC transporter permease [Staphylococcus sp. HMSC10C03]OHR53052.1 ABC transporter permease [Staphylococcus sp. HMSC070A02]OHR57921.1 ABC transporter permease [Staphylococcus sp. HMSC070A03]